MRKLLVIAFFSIIAYGLPSCSNKAAEGKELAKTYCASCHLLPDPASLPKNVWQYSTLPYMGIMMGVDKEIGMLEKPLSDYTILGPGSQMIPDEDWEKIKAYYLEEAPKTLEMPAYIPLATASIFKPEPILATLPGTTLPNMTAVRIDARRHQITAGDQSNRVIWKWDATGKLLETKKDQDALTDITLLGSETLYTFIGTTTQANPEVNGFVSQASKGKKIIQGLNRPIGLVSANLDGEAGDELITSEFGFKVGGMSVWKLEKGVYRKQVLNPQTGATKTIVRDFTGDGRLDILAQFAQGDERILLYENVGGLKFKEKQLLRFPSIYGSSSFDVVDIDGDKDLDIIYTAGDNADFTTVLKPYHGMYVFENTGGFNFKQKAFFSQNGATKVMPGDFDGDGDADLISIALFPDVAARPGEGAMYFENKKGTFVPMTLPIQHLGRWSVMDVADLDGDGDLDVALGSHAVAKFPQGGFDPQWKQAKGLLILRNKTK
ncbi:MAG: hypothetical protein RL422_1496 [Bacteroidota bacterium]|jgi:hypothetical protein